MITAVTGAAGHLGANLVRALLDHGAHVRALVRNDSRAVAGLPVETVYADLFDPDSLRRAFTGTEVVFHLAGRISISGPQQGAVETTNVIGTRHVARACLDAGARRLVHFSSIHALAAKPRHAIIDETRGPAGPDAPAYDRTKAAGEREALAAMTHGLDVVILNPTAVIGPHDYKPSAMGQVILDLCRRRLPALVTGGFNWVDARDVAQAAVAAAERGRPGERYLLGGEWRSLVGLARAIEQTSGVPAPPWLVPMTLARLAAPFAELWAHASNRRPLFTRESLLALRNHRLIRHDKAQRELDYHPRPLTETIRDTVAWFRQNPATQ